MKRWRHYLSSAAATVALFLMVGLAFAGPGELPEEASDKAEEVQSSKAEKTKEPKATETVEGEVEAQVEGEDVVNHGHCISYWAHKSKAEGLQGRARGQLISTIAQDEEAVSVKVEENATPDGKCGSYQGQLDQAKADAAASTSTARGKGKGKAKGGPAAGS